MQKLSPLQTDSDLAAGSGSKTALEGTSPSFAQTLGNLPGLQALFCSVHIDAACCRGAGKFRMHAETHSALAGTIWANTVQPRPSHANVSSAADDDLNNCCRTVHRVQVLEDIDGLVSCYCKGVLLTCTSQEVAAGLTGLHPS